MAKQKDSKTKEKISGKRKAAIFLVTVGSDIAAQIFKYLKEDEVEQLTFEIARIDKVDAEERDKVLVEFQELMMAQDFIQTGGIDYAKELLEKALGSQKAIDIITRLTTTIQVRPFDFIKRTDPSHLINFIQNEHPQTIALILSYLEPKKASNIIAALNPDLQADVAKRIATMDRTNPEVVREVERILERQISAIATEEFASVGGIPTVVEILNSADSTTMKNILEKLEEEDPDLAEEIKKNMFVFEDIVQLDDKSVQRLLREVDMADVAKALKNVDTEVQDKIFRNLSKRSQTLLKEDMEFMGPIRLKDVEEAQSKIVAVIRRLEEQGEIQIARGGEDEIIY
jgi:flagellar motor switch protein FliG